MPRFFPASLRTYARTHRPINKHLLLFIGLCSHHLTNGGQLGMLTHARGTSFQGISTPPSKGDRAPLHPIFGIRTYAHMVRNSKFCTVRAKTVRRHLRTHQNYCSTHTTLDDRRPCVSGGGSKSLELPAAIRPRCSFTSRLPPWTQNFLSSGNCHFLRTDN